MRILLTGASGYIGKRLLPALLAAGHEVVCCVRDKSRFAVKAPDSSRARVVEIDFQSDEPSAHLFPEKIDAAYYLIHSMTSGVGDFAEAEARAAANFKRLAEELRVQQVIYLGGLVNATELSVHLQSRKNVGEILSSGSYATTTLRAAIVIGSGSASFEIIRDLVEKLPVMVAPRWLHTRTQPIAIRNVIAYLAGVLLKEECMHEEFDIGGPDILTYQDMLLIFAEERGLTRRILTLPVMTPRLSSYWLYFVTSVSYPLAVNLVNSMRTEAVCRDTRIRSLVETPLIPYREAIRLAFDKIEQNEILSSWKDSFSSGRIMLKRLSEQIEIPTHGCFVDRRSTALAADPDLIVSRLWSIGGENGWYYASWLWTLRGWLDKLVGGVGLRRGRLHPVELSPGDALDFWRVLVADKVARRLVLYAEMRLPGEAWLEFRVETTGKSAPRLVQTATFRPRGLLGRLYWYSLVPFHYFIFNGMMRTIASAAGSRPSPPASLKEST